MKVYIGPYRDGFGSHFISRLLERVGVERPMRRKILDWWEATPIFKLVPRHQGQKIEVKIDDWDTWSADFTLAHIVLPLLKRLSTEKQGSPWVDDEDVPEVLRSTYAPPKEDEWDTDEFFHQRWEWVLNEIIWAFNEIVTGENEEPFDVENEDWRWRSRMYYERKKRAFMLFGKYYECLWT